MFMTAVKEKTRKQFCLRSASLAKKNADVGFIHPKGPEPLTPASSDIYDEINIIIISLLPSTLVTIIIMTAVIFL